MDAAKEVSADKLSIIFDEVSELLVEIEDFLSDGERDFIYDSQKM